MLACCAAVAASIVVSFSAAVAAGGSSKLDMIAIAFVDESLSDSYAAHHFSNRTPPPSPLEPTWFFSD
jgi:hypothetical protein